MGRRNAVLSRVNSASHFRHTWGAVSHKASSTIVAISISVIIDTDPFLFDSCCRCEQFVLCTPSSQSSNTVLFLNPETSLQGPKTSFLNLRTVSEGLENREPTAMHP